MRTYLIAVIVAAALLVACNKSSVSAKSGEAAKSGDPVTKKLQEAAGSGATDCGRVKFQEQDKLKPAGDCALNAAKDKHAFYVAYDMPGLIVGVAGDSQGKLTSVQSEAPENAPAGAQAEVKSAPCPAELRFAQSGRVTCMTPGSAMGSMGGGANPHGAVPPATGENPHGGMGAPPAGTANPHGTAQPSHSSKDKTPPKQ